MSLASIAFEETGISGCNVVWPLGNVDDVTEVKMLVLSDPVARKDEKAAVHAGSCP